MQEFIVAFLVLFVLAFVQNVSFSIVSRSRNRNNMKFHLVAAFFSNSVWFLTFRELVTQDMSLSIFPAYCIGTMFGSVFGVQISMRIEQWLGAESDSHLSKPKIDVAMVELERRVKAIEDTHPATFFVTDNKPALQFDIIRQEVPKCHNCAKYPVKCVGSPEFIAYGDHVAPNCHKPQK